MVGQRVLSDDVVVADPTRRDLVESATEYNLVAAIEKHGVPF